MSFECAREIPDFGEKANRSSAGRFLDYLRRSTDTADAQGNALRTLADALNQLPDRYFVPTLKIDRLKFLRQEGLSREVVMALEKLVQQGAAERDVVVLVLYLLMQSAEGSGLKRAAQRAIHKAYRKGVLPEDLKQEVADVLELDPEGVQ